MDNEPIFRITEVNIAKNDRAAFRKEQEAELENSIPVENGTLLFASAHEDAEGEKNYIVELYRNPKAWEEHSMADYFDHYDQVINELADSRKAFDLKPVWITSKPKEALDENANNFIIHLAKVEVQDGKNDDFAAIVKKEMRRSMAQEPGVELLMGGTNKENSNEWYFFEVFTNDEAYKKHQASKWFKQYLADSEAIVKDKQVHELVRDVMAVQGPIVMD
ncbi:MULTISPECIES: putative quinol monooxygenase [Lactobacillus]|uniref:Antibiotic biosynthesis monooxygenase n=1 Tax=Lactobacillus xujianguonis TaxID=2495899 RepID=A0A437SVC5_9LACO|nr:MULTISPECIES: antibiotic biosynthesis monooxygenase [Lactobacillus]RVU70797.1 antibiotic biosynthesis monooxygenase [Lactobacillus xujianguonis]RVU77011.1 antibiotic biosynthesis monooxygenase [Lactobacillus xujianguonis]